VGKTKIEGCDLIHSLLSNWESEEIRRQCRLAFEITDFDCSSLNYLVKICKVEANTGLVLANALDLLERQSVPFLRTLLTAITAAQTKALLDRCPEIEAYLPEHGVSQYE